MNNFSCRKLDDFINQALEPVTNIEYSVQSIKSILENLEYYQNNKDIDSFKIDIMGDLNEITDNIREIWSRF